MALLPKYAPATLQAIKRFVDVAFKSQDSLFTPGAKIWSPGVRADLYERFVRHPDESNLGFMQKFQQQLNGGPKETIQLAAELLYAQLLTPVSRQISATKKVSLVETVLSWSPESPACLPDDLKAGLNEGLSGDMAFMLGRPYHLAFILETLRAWDDLDSARREKLLNDAWEFKRFLKDIPVSAAQPMREILCFFVHPSKFEAITSRKSKQKIVRAFKSRLASPAGDDDKDLLAIRELLSKEHGEQFSFFQPEIKDSWDGTTPAREPKSSNSKKGGIAVSQTMEDLANELFLDVGFLLDTKSLLNN